MPQKWTEGENLFFFFSFKFVDKKNANFKEFTQISMFLDRI
jgi:hypothetical protein